MKITPARLALILCLPAALSLTSARANDGGIAWGGSPSLLKSHPSVAMESEVVNITIGPENVLVDCRFVFKNKGASTAVRMGFPDDGYGDGSSAGDGDWSHSKALSGFNWFKSWVDGVPSKVELVKSSTPGLVWHAKSVAFKANARRVVRDQYSVPVGSQIVRDGVYYQTAYTLHTGSSWAGPIGRSEVNVRFSRPLGASRVRTIGTASVPFVVEDGERDYLYGKAMKPGVVVVDGGPGMPTVSGTSLCWVRTNWRPTAKDDILIFFGFKSFPKL